MADRDIDDLADDLEKAAVSTGRQVRGIMAKGLDRAAARAKSDAEVKWTRSGRGTGDSAGSIRARMDSRVGSRGGETQVGYLFVDGGGVFQESGTGHHPPNPVLGPALAAEVDWTVKQLDTIDLLP